jgi:tetratricopeptide (TPR) repeat protein
VTAVVFLITLELWKDLRVAGIAAALFAVHPVHTEPVVWIAAVPDLAYTLFFLVGLYCYVMKHEPELHAGIAFVACYAVALLWKESAITFLPCVILYDAFVLRQFRVRRFAALAGITGLYLLVRIVVLGGIAPGVMREHLSWTTQALTAISHLGMYGQKLLIPVNLTFFYRLQAVNSIDLRVVAVVLVLALALWKLRGKAAWSLFWIPLTLLPAVALSRVAVPLAERNLYLASVGFVWLAAQALVHLSSVRSFVLLGALSAAYVTVDWFRVPAWQTELSLFGQALHLDPDNVTIRLRLSTELGRRGKIDEAMVQLEEILKREPRHLDALTNKAGLLVYRKDWQGVDATCALAFNVKPDSPKCHLAAGVAELNRGRKEQAWEHFDRAYESNPRLWQALLEQGTMALDEGDFTTAIQKLERVVVQSPTAPAFTVLGTAYVRIGDSPKAEAAFTEALRLNPTFVPARQALASILRK